MCVNVIKSWPNVKESWDNAMVVLINVTKRWHNVMEELDNAIVVWVNVIKSWHNVMEGWHNATVVWVNVIKSWYNVMEGWHNAIPVSCYKAVMAFHIDLYNFNPMFSKRLCRIVPAHFVVCHWMLWL